MQFSISLYVKNPTSLENSSLGIVHEKIKELSMEK